MYLREVRNFKELFLTLASLKTVREIASSLSIFFATSGQFLDTCSDIRLGSCFLQPRSPRGFKISKEATFNRRLHRKNEPELGNFLGISPGKSRDAIINMSANLSRCIEKP